MSSLRGSVFTLEGPDLRGLGASTAPAPDVAGALRYIQNAARSRYGAYPSSGTVVTLGVVEAVTKLFAPATELAKETADNIYGVYSRDLERARTRWAAALGKVLAGTRTPMPGATLVATVLAATDAAVFWDEATRFAIQLTAILDQPATVAARGVVNQAVFATPAVTAQVMPPPAALPVAALPSPTPTTKKKAGSRVGWWIAGVTAAAAVGGLAWWKWRR